jgi:hypothetical protein
VIDLEQEPVLHFESFHQGLLGPDTHRIVSTAPICMPAALRTGRAVPTAITTVPAGRRIFHGASTTDSPPVDGARQWQLVRRIWQVVHGEKFAVFRIRVGRHIKIVPSVNLFGGTVHADHAAVGIGYDDAFAELVQHHRLEAFNRTQHSLRL